MAVLKSQMSPKVWRLATVENIQKTICWTNEFTVGFESPNSVDAQDSKNSQMGDTTAGRSLKAQRELERSQETRAESILSNTFWGVLVCLRNFIFW